MSTIRYTASLLYYDGPQIIEARDDEGHDYLALLVESDGEDRYLAVEVAADRLRQFRSGALDLRMLLTESAEDGWYLTTTADLDQPLTIERQQTPVEESGFLPADGFVLHESDSPVERKQETVEVPTRPPKLADSAEARAEITRALRLDLVGPGADGYLAYEQLPGWVRPSNWYLTGFLVPRHAGFEQRADADSGDEMEPEVCEDIGAGDDSSEDRRAAKAGFFPSSMGLSFLAAPGTDRVTAVVRWGDYRKVEGKVSAEEGSELPDRWQRAQCEATLSIVLPEDDSPRHLPVPDSRGLEVHVVARTMDPGLFAGKIAQGTRSVSIFLVNARAPAEDDRRDEAFAFQAEIEVRSDVPFAVRPDLRPVSGDNWDERVADLHYADVPEYASGHGVAATWEAQSGVCRALRTHWTPIAEVEHTESLTRLAQTELDMAALGRLADAEAVRTALTPLVTAYREWIEAHALGDLPEQRKEVAQELLRRARLAASRMEKGIGVLASDADVRDAFCMANRAVAGALARRIEGPPRWRAFQLAFVLLNLPGIADPSDPEREIVDLLFFPTGGGKTEAYLGLAAFTMALRRLRRPADEGRAGAGVSVIMRYTLRLLTLDQLGRAAALVCALELERQRDVGRYGVWPFEIGLWVGKAGTPNWLGKKGDGNSDSARTKVNRYKDNPRARPIPIPLENCPWCAERFTPDSFALLPNADAPTDLRISCSNWECEFSGDPPLPIVAVDEPLYRRLPAFLIATVDKFASLPWVGQSGALLGGADRFDTEGFYSAADPGRGNPLTTPLLPPDLVIQDEMHLISGPLGTMTGLYEAAIERLCVREAEGRIVRPKIVASTATVRQAHQHIQALFARPGTDIFPPPGPDRRHSFFARTVPAVEKNARQYVGVAAQGRNPKVVMRRVLLALMAAAERIWRDAGGPRNKHNPADPYMTALGYFNSLRELGGARRILEEEVQNTLKGYSNRKRLNETASLFRDRTRFSDVVELTSRVSADQVAVARRRLERPFFDDKGNERIDCAIATNMISVGLDIQRLGLMVVNGQPKTHAEYIQATSRVGRDDSRPGLVVTLYNVHKPRDRSHYEQFLNYHNTFYRSVEVVSVTPFAARALDRGFAGALVGLARHGRTRMTPRTGAQNIEAERAVLEPLLLHAFEERVRGQPVQGDAERDERLRSIQRRVGDLLDSWTAIWQDYHASGAAMQYQRYERGGAGKPLLREMLDTEFESEHHRKFRANRSLRDVEPAVDLYVQDLPGALDGGGG